MLFENPVIRRRASLMTLAACLLILGVAATPARAQTTSTFIALLNSGQEVPSNTSKAFGVAFVTFNTDTSELCWSISYTDSSLTSTETAAHFHASAPPGQNAAVKVPLPLGSPKNGCATPDLTDQEVSDLFAGLWYVNVHTTNFGGGEIRGQVIPQSNPIF